MLTIKFAKSFKKSYKKLSQKEQDIFAEVSKKLANNELLDKKYKDHALTGNFQGYRECHLKPDLLLMYKKLEAELILYCVDIGSHSEFGL